MDKVPGWDLDDLYSKSKHSKLEVRIDDEDVKTLIEKGLAVPDGKNIDGTLKFKLTPAANQLLQTQWEYDQMLSYIADGKHRSRK